jgi:hypothetical protein
VALVASFVTVDILCPGGDVVRRDGVDDPAGGVLDGAVDRFRLVLPGTTVTSVSSGFSLMWFRRCAHISMREES